MMILLAILTGFLTTLVIRRTSNASKLRATTKRIQAHLLEFRLFFDEPRFIWQAWMSLLRENLRLLVYLLPATLILAVPMTWLFFKLDPMYSRRPLHPGEAAVVTAKHLDLPASAGFRIETPPIHVLHDNQIVWRIRATIDGPMIVKKGLQIDYPKSDAAIPWPVWFLLASTASAIISMKVTL